MKVLEGVEPVLGALFWAHGPGVILASDRDKVLSLFMAPRTINRNYYLMNFILCFLVLLSLLGPCYAADIPCASRAVDRAKQLLTFHSGADDRMSIDKTVKQLPSIRNPENPAQSFQVLEVWGNIYKGRYRMRFLYFNSRATSCLLMGEEILEYARP
jgi:hypothetical protein